MKLRSKSFVLDLLWFIVALPIAFTIVPLGDYLAYLDGIQLCPRSILLLPFSLAMGACLTGPFFARFVIWHREYALGRILLVSVLVLIVFVSPLTCSFAFRKPYVPTFTKGLLDRLEKDVDPNDLQKWALRELSAHANGKPDSDVYRLVEQELPSSLKRLTDPPPHIDVDMFSDDVSAPHIFMMWGSGFGHWRLLVGGENLAVPDLRGFYFVKWRPGIYVFWMS